MDTEQTLRRFIGSVVACFTHEIQNNLATIHAAAGLMDDMVAKGKSIDPAQLARLAAMTNRHIGSALRLIRHLNGYGHRLDDEVSSFCLDDVMEELLALTGRICREKQVDVRTLSRDGRAMVRGDAILLQSVVFRILETILESAPGDTEGVTVTIQTRRSKRAATIEIKTGEGLQTSSWTSRLPDDQRIQPLLRSLGATLTVSPERETVVLEVPAHEPTAGESR